MCFYFHDPRFIKNVLTKLNCLRTLEEQLKKSREVDTSGVDRVDNNSGYAVQKF